MLEDAVALSQWSFIRLRLERSSPVSLSANKFKSEKRCWSLTTSGSSHNQRTSPTADLFQSHPKSRKWQLASWYLPSKPYDKLRLNEGFLLQKKLIKNFSASSFFFFPPRCKEREGRFSLERQKMTIINFFSLPLHSGKQLSGLLSLSLSEDRDFKAHYAVERCW